MSRSKPVYNFPESLQYYNSAYKVVFLCCVQKDDNIVDFQMYGKRPLADCRSETRRAGIPAVGYKMQGDVEIDRHK